METINIIAFAETLRDRFLSPAFSRIRQGNSAVSVYNLPATPEVLACRDILRESPWTLVTNQDVWDSISYNPEIVPQPVGSIETREFAIAGDIFPWNSSGANVMVNALKRAAVEGRIRVFACVERDDPIFRYKEVPALELKKPTTTWIEDLTVAADEMVSKGLWLGEPLALYLGARKGQGVGHSKKIKREASDMLRERIKRIVEYDRSP